MTYTTHNGYNIRPSTRGNRENISGRQQRIIMDHIHMMPSWVHPDYIEHMSYDVAYKLIAQHCVKG